MYIRARDHCTSAKHIVQLCLNVIKVSVSLHTHAHTGDPPLSYGLCIGIRMLLALKNADDTLENITLF